MNRIIFAAALCFAMLPGLAHAEPGLAQEVYSPALERGETELEVRSGFLNGGPDDGDWQTKIEAAHAFTSWWRPALVAEWEHEGSDTKMTAAAIENVFDFTGTRDWPVHFGAYAEYEFNTQDGPDALELKLLAERKRGPVTLRLNLIGERPLEDSGEWESGYAAQASYAVNDDFSVGIQGFGDTGVGSDIGSLGDRAQYWGPFAEFEVAHVGKQEVGLQIGYLAGFGEAAADGQFRVKLEWEFGESDPDGDGD